MSQAKPRVVRDLNEAHKIARQAWEKGQRALVPGWRKGHHNKDTRRLSGDRVLFLEARPTLVPTTNVGVVIFPSDYPLSLRSEIVAKTKNARHVQVSREEIKIMVTLHEDAMH